MCELLELYYARRWEPQQDFATRRMITTAPVYWGNG